MRGNYIYKYGNEIIDNFKSYNNIDECVEAGINYSNFTNYLESENFTFYDDRDELIEIIQKSVKELEFDSLKLDGIHHEIDILDKAVQDDKKQDLILHKDIIETRIMGEYFD